MTHPMTEPMPRFNRRVALGTLAALTTPPLSSSRCASGAEAPDDWPIAAFTKPFNSLSYDELAVQLAAIGFSGVEATVRRGGNVEPERVEEQLPQLVTALDRAGLKLTIFTSDISGATGPVDRRVMQTAADLGLTMFRMAYLRYDLKQPIKQQLQGWRPRVAALAQHCEQLGLTALYQNHAGGKNLGAAIWDLDVVLQDVAPEQVGVAYDIRHAVVEGGESWPITWEMIRPKVKAIYVKDFAWQNGKTANVPLGQGQVPAAFVKQLVKNNYPGPISLHEEYLDHNDPLLVPQHLAAMKTDLATLRSWLNR